jgi:cyclomaltodextrinase / maltogenic alpha-amylase / neopullulanase
MAIAMTGTPCRTVRRDKEARLASWIDRSIFYHIYPLGLLDAPKRDDWGDGLEHRLPGLQAWIPHLTGIGCNAVYLGPVFSSVSHGYDTTDFVEVDPRLGDREDLRGFVHACHEAGVHVIFDGVFNHVGRAFFAFRDVQEHGEASAYKEWFRDLQFGQESPAGDPFTYYAYEGNFDMPVLNLQHPDVRQHLFDAVRAWFSEYWADGIRFDAVEKLDKEFVREICAVARESNPDCWLMGEVLASDYREWTEPGLLDSCTNYEVAKGLPSAFNDRNLFEIAHSLNRQFGPEGIYRDRLLYSFVDNHDVTRVATTLARADEDLASLYTILYTMPGVPSIYYGSEWGVEGAKEGPNDDGMRAPMSLPDDPATVPRPWLPEHLAKLALVRQEHDAIRHGDYTELHVASEQFAFRRAFEGDIVVVAVNAWDEGVELDLEAGVEDGVELIDAIDGVTTVTAEGGRLHVPVGPNSARVLRRV